MDALTACRIVSLSLSYPAPPRRLIANCGVVAEAGFEPATSGE